MVVEYEKSTTDTSHFYSCCFGVTIIHEYVVKEIPQLCRDVWCSIAIYIFNLRKPNVFDDVNDDVN